MQFCSVDQDRNVAHLKEGVLLLWGKLGSSLIRGANSTEPLKQETGTGNSTHEPQAAPRQPQRYLGIHVTAGGPAIRTMMPAAKGNVWLVCNKTWQFYLVELRIERLLFHGGFVLRLFVLIRLQIPAGGETEEFIPPNSKRLVMQFCPVEGAVAQDSPSRTTGVPRQLSLIKFNTSLDSQFHSDKKKR